MLYKNHICNVQSQNFALMQDEYMRKVIPGDNISLLLPLNQMFIQNSNLAYSFACETYKVFVNQHRCTEDDFKSNYAQLATYGVALSGMFFAYELATGKMSLYTSSISVLNFLASRGMLVGKKDSIVIELQDITKKLYDSDRIKKSIKDGNKIVSVRLDPSIVNQTVVFTATIPRSALTLTDYIFVPYSAMSKAYQSLSDILKDKVFKIVQGDKVRYVTRNAGLLCSIYGNERTSYLLSQLPDARIQRFYLPSVGASIYTAGVTNIHLDKVDSVQYVTSLAEIDLSEIKLDYSQAKDFFLDTFRKLPAEGVHAVAEGMGIEATGNARDVRKEVITHLDDMYDSEVYKLMKGYPQFFDLDKYKKLPSKFGDKYESVVIPSSKEDLVKLLQEGIYKILLIKRSGSFSTVICTNDKKSLAKIYGLNYFKYYESDGNRLRALGSIIKAKYPNKITVDKFVKARTKYNLGFVCSDMISDNSAPDKELDSSMILGEIDKWLREVEMRKNVVKQPHLVTVRSCEAKLDKDRNPVDFYKSIDLNSIVQITRLS